MVIMVTGKPCEYYSKTILIYKLFVVNGNIKIVQAYFAI
ncbi:hypothetical protein Desca_2003 [Desulfotomaculum nigrificans CO-1-SRB]|uniref:Uncharacterized protein n=1 Tax=Desulfotomaculum nigrificans (strain DSM 14880 / VKM B-2319 / CO-1-SRB) TaxID=868595 RepID=F6B970_DESCC|nr:hypothetical protein Desca_2003 [Desulfotomaculum nigrificans CO-1-SRB]